MKKKPTANIIARAQDMRSGTSRCVACCIGCNPFQHIARYILRWGIINSAPTIRIKQCIVWATLVVALRPLATLVVALRPLATLVVARLNPTLLASHGVQGQRPCRSARCPRTTLVSFVLCRRRRHKTKTDEVGLERHFNLSDKPHYIYWFHGDWRTRSQKFGRL